MAAIVAPVPVAESTPSLSADEEVKALRQTRESHKPNGTKKFWSLDELQDRLKHNDLEEKKRQTYEAMVQLLKDTAQSGPLNTQSAKMEDWHELPCHQTQYLTEKMDGKVTLEIWVDYVRKNADWTVLSLYNYYDSQNLYFDFRPAGGAWNDGVLVLNCKDPQHGWHYENTYDFPGLFRYGVANGYRIRITQNPGWNDQWLVSILLPGNNGAIVLDPYTDPEGSWTLAEKLFYDCRQTATSCFGPSVWWRQYKNN